MRRNPLIGALKFIGIACVAASLTGTIWFGIKSLNDRLTLSLPIQMVDEERTGREVLLLDQNGTFMGYKMTYEGHDYLKVSNSGGIVHSESCPCKNVEMEEIP